MVADTDEQKAALDRFRVAMKFSLWAWALYWPGMGIMLTLLGMDLVSVVVALVSVVGFVLMIRSGALQTTSSRNVKEFVLERPIYLILAVVVFLLGAPLLGAIATTGLMLYATAYLAAIVLSIVRLTQFVRAMDMNVFKAKADQTIIVLSLAGMGACAIFADAWLGLGGLALGNSAVSVAVLNWIGILYPALLLVSTRPLREKLINPLRRKVEEEEAPAPEGVAA